MEEISVSKAKATFLALVEEVSKSGKAVRVTKRGKVIAVIEPVRSAMDRRKWLGSMRGTAKILGDIVGPIIDENDWDALK
ncbi:MAG: type II toxin-antitoxin system prevent-host-death family antitoxin [Acidobacteriales bacterium]|nr:type II toxin-antitoxin system prevent-host-death family antitoxin [Terriglobales bacterium]